MINEEDKVIIVGKPDISQQELIDKLKETNPNVVVVDDINDASKLLKSDYHKEAVYEYKNNRVLDNGHAWAGGITKKQINAPEAEPVRSTPKVYNNDPCPCGSGKKYKKCCK